jgi:hypothetical protein
MKSLKIRNIFSLHIWSLIIKLQHPYAKAAMSNLASSVAKGGAMGHLHPPSRIFQALDIVEVFGLSTKTCYKGGFVELICGFAPPKTNFWPRH